MVRRVSTIVGAALVMTIGAGSALAEGPSGPDSGETPDAVEQAPPAPTTEEATEAPPTGPVVVPPSPLEVPQAVYPPEALAAGLEADVVLVLDISAEGLVTAAQSKAPVGHGFDEAAVEAILRMRFQPATVDGVPQAVRVNYTYRFTIAQKEALSLIHI